MEFEHRWSDLKPEFLIWKCTCTIGVLKYFWWICLNLSLRSIIIIITNNLVSLASLTPGKTQAWISSITCLLWTGAAVHEYSWRKSLNRQTDFTLSIWLQTSRCPSAGKWTTFPNKCASRDQNNNLLQPFLSPNLSMFPGLPKYHLTGSHTSL